MASTQDYPTIKALVLEFVHRCAGRVDYDALTREVRKHFPSSKWQRTHWAWYRCQIRRGRFKALFSEAERAALSHTRCRRAGAAAAVPERRDDTALLRGPRARDAEIKRIGDALLSHVRLVISLAAGDEPDQRFKLNRWVFSRLLQDEIRVKRPIKRLLWDRGARSCHACGKAFASLKGVEIHRKDESQGYSADNCVLACRDCHQETG
jgi:hypothetical protein